MTEWQDELQSPCLSFNAGTFAYRKIDRHIASTQISSNRGRLDAREGVLQEKMAVDKRGQKRVRTVCRHSRQRDGEFGTRIAQ